MKFKSLLMEVISKKYSVSGLFLPVNIAKVINCLMQIPLLSLSVTSDVITLKWFHIHIDASLIFLEESKQLYTDYIN